MNESVSNEKSLMEKERLTCSAAARDLKEIRYAPASADSMDSNWPVV